MAIEVFPTANDIGGSGTGRTATEENMVQTLDRFSSQSSILSGMVPSAGTGLAVDVAAGRCQIDGYLVRFTATEAVTVTASETDDYLWLQLTGAGDSPPAVTGTVWVETNDLTSPPANAALVAKFTTSGSAVTAIEDDERREGCGFITATYTGDGAVLADTQSISLGSTPAYVRINHPNYLTNTAKSAFIWPGNTPIIQPAIADWDLIIERDGFKVRDGTGTGFNDSGIVYPYVAWF